MKRMIFACLHLAAFAFATPALGYESEMLQEMGEPENRLDILIMGDGYREEDQDQLVTDAERLVEGMMAQAPFGRYASYFNIKLLHVISEEAGADNGAAGGLKDTALGAYFNCNGTDRLLCVDSGAIFDIAATDAPEYDQILIIVNDTKYGGSGGAIATSSIAPTARDIAIHEVGHSLYGLADEYDTPYTIPRCDPDDDCPEANMTVYTEFEDIKWNHWIEDGTPLPTPQDDPEYGTAVGAFEGGRYFPDDQYR